jgi:hypothetical protein
MRSSWGGQINLTDHARWYDHDAADAGEPERFGGAFVIRVVIADDHAIVREGVNDRLPTQLTFASRGQQRKGAMSLIAVALRMS